MKRILCWIGLHDWAILDWNETKGRQRCTRCDRIEPLRGTVLAEWIRWRTRRALEN